MSKELKKRKGGKITIWFFPRDSWTEEDINGRERERVLDKHILRGNIKCENCAAPKRVFDGAIELLNFLQEHKYCQEN